MHDRPFPFTRPVASIAAVTDHESFAALIERHRSELHRHCIRVLRSPADAEDALQDALLRAWRARHTVAAESARAWLYRIATNACYDRLAGRKLMLVSLDHEPVDAAAPPEQTPDAIVLAQETVDLALLAAIRHLPSRQQAVLVMRDVLSWSAHDAATALSMSVAATNSALQRARSNLRAHLAPDRLTWRSGAPSRSQRETLRRYLAVAA
jgi:RNA polymerase sigma-70 factor (ECF subfamily)